MSGAAVILLDVSARRKEQSRLGRRRSEASCALTSGVTRQRGNRCATRRPSRGAGKGRRGLADAVEDMFAWSHISGTFRGQRPASKIPRSAAQAAPFLKICPRPRPGLPLEPQPSEPTGPADD